MDDIDLWFLTLVKNLLNKDTIGGKGCQNQFSWVSATRPDFVINTINLLEKFRCLMEKPLQQS
jgi:hypothetical protein